MKEVKNKRDQKQKTRHSPLAKSVLSTSSLPDKFSISQIRNVTPSLTEAKHWTNDKEFITEKKIKTKIKSNNYVFSPNEIQDNACNDSPSSSNATNVLFTNDSDEEVEDFSFTGSAINLFGNSTDNLADISCDGSQINNFNLETTKEKYENLSYNELDVAEGKLVIVKDSSKLYIHGVVQVNVLKGCFEILGCRLTENQSCEIFSPRGTSLLYLSKTSSSTKAKNASLKKMIDLNGLEAIEFLNKAADADAIILFKKINSKLVNVLDNYVPQQLFPKNDLKLKFVSNFNDLNALDITASWRSLIDQITPKSRTLICGGKGVGKSTLLRYLVNNLLQKHEKVLVIDLDPGQPEFTISGCVSAVVVTKPLLGPNYTHLQKPERCFYVPNISVLHLPLEYLESVKSLMAVYKNFDDFPTIINSMGYARNLGAELLSSIISLTNPSQVFQINSQNVSRNCNINFNVNINKESANFFTPDAKLDGRFKVHQLDAPSDKCNGWECGPKQSREMCIFSYFSQIATESASLTDSSVSTYMISLDSISIITPKNTVNSYAVANANIVSLCSFVEVRNSIKIFECHGWGIVRAIDLKKNLLYLITPLSQGDLKQVKFLMVGSVKTPSLLYLKTVESSDIVPYLSCGFQSPFSQIPKRAFIPKK